MSDPPPTLTVNLGDPIVEVVRSAGLPFPRKEVLDFDLHVIQVPVIVRYNHPEKPFTLPPTRFVSFELTLARVARIRTSPHLAYVQREGTVNLVTELGATFGKAGWKGPSDLHRDLDAALKELDSTPSNSARADCGLWKDGHGTEVSITLQRKYKAGGVFDAMIGKQDQFLVDIAVHHAKFYQQIADDAVRARSSAGLPQDKMRTIRLDPPK